MKVILWLFRSLHLIVVFFLHTCKRLLQSIFFTVLLVALPVLALFTGVASGILQGLWDELPEVQTAMYSPALASRILDRNQQLIDTVADIDSRLNLVQIENLPPYIAQSFIAIEDERFYWHFGIDPIRIAGVILQGLRQGELTAGASTITQQLIRNVYLSPEKNFTRKIREILLALRMEYRFTKSEILEMYLNTVFFGQNYYGIESAAYNYFSKTTQELTIAEVAVLSSMMKAPNRYNPLVNPQASRRRQRAVLAKMLELGMVDRKTHDNALAEKIIIRQPVEKRRQQTSQAPYFVEHVRKEVADIIGQKRLMEGGLRVITTLDMQLQAIANTVFATSPLFQTYTMDKYPGLSGSMIVRDVASGDILSMIGGRSYQISQFNRATQARRQVGSAFKPIVYAAAFESGLPPNTLLNDVPITWRMEHLQQEWSPENYGGRYHGPSLLRQALEQSFNLTAIQLIERTGVDAVVDLSRRMGITAPFQQNRTIALGSTEIVPLEMVSAFASFANQGIYVRPRSVLRIEDSAGVILYESPHTEQEVMSAESAFRVYDMLRSVVQKGSGRRALVTGLDVAGKTGTNQDYIDAWFIGLTPRLAVSVSYGFNDRTTLGKKASSSLVAAPVVGEFFRSVKDQAAHWVTSGEVAPPRTLAPIQVCSVSGMVAQSGCRVRSSEYFLREQMPRIPCTVHNPIAALETYLHFELEYGPN